MILVKVKFKYITKKENNYFDTAKKETIDLFDATEKFTYFDLSFKTGRVFEYHY